MQYYDYPLTAGNIRFLFETPGFAIGLSQPAAVPEPATLWLLGLAACGLGGYARRRRKA